jgi:hypothetical protein
MLTRSLLISTPASCVSLCTGALGVLALVLGACADPIVRGADPPVSSRRPSQPPDPTAAEEATAPIERTTGSPGRLLVYSAITGHIPVADQTGPGMSDSQREAARAAMLEAEIEEELRRGGSPGGAPELGIIEAPAPAEEENLDRRANPMIAPNAPSERELPEAIYEDSEVTIAEGAWGDNAEQTVLQRNLDVDEDGVPEQVRYVDPASGKVVRQESDSDYDGEIDVWQTYQAGEIATRAADSNGDGAADVWESYSRGRMIERTVDRDTDGVQDAFYRYDGDLLAEERHDSDSDGRVDRVVTYSDLHRESAQEDRSGDGKVDTWTTYQIVDGQDHVARIERDQHGTGQPSLVEIYEVTDGKALLARREEDVNGDGSIDIVSIYENGRLVQRQISDPDLAPL